METKRSRRIRHSRQDWQGFVSEFLTSGQDCKSFCRDKGLNPSRLIRWQGYFAMRFPCHQPDATRRVFGSGYAACP
ncbi:hypothetical protein [Ferrovum myxofaciens]|uniref:hypothetical protein n=1 Tax=Ferrovum myxofaciens TaxID=416213 RepID=UPI003EB8FC29